MGTTKEYYAKNREARIAAAKQYRKDNKERLKEYDRKRYLNDPIVRGGKHKARKKPNPEKTRNARYLRVYGITVEQYNHLLEAQNNRCAGCNKHKDDFKVKLAVDHCHKSGKVRGLLCDLCNRALGMLKDDPETLKRLIDYLANKA